jgi:diguanylate cyclase (GGDEF)-like protein/PAS domain S-box-containing protein
VRIKISTPRSQYIQALSFAVVIILMGLLLSVDLRQMSLQHEHLKQIVYVQNAKLELASDMRRVARERSLSLHRMLVLDDPFAIDEEWLQFNRFGSQFADKRSALLAMDLDEEERKILKEQGRLTGEAVDAQLAVAQHALDGEIEKANQILRKRAMPIQNQVFGQLNRLNEYQLKLISQAASDAEVAYTTTRNITYLLGTLAILLGVYFALFAVRRTARAERKLYEEMEKAQVTLESIGDGVITTDGTGMIEYLNVTAENLSGWKNHEACGRQLNQVFNVIRESDRSQITDLGIHDVSVSRPFHSTSDVLLVGKDGTEHAVEYTLAAVPNPDGRHSRLVLGFHDVSTMRKLSHQLSHQASHDALTGLINRRAFELHLEQAIESAHADHLQHALCYLDLDQFKIVNDTCGHLAGDELLKQIGNRFHGLIRHTDVLARLGGDEFGVLLEDCPEGKAMLIAQEFCNNLGEYRFAWEDKVFDVGVSVGLIFINRESGSMYDVLSRVDSACYVAKEQGRNRVHVYHHEDEALSQRTSEMEWVHIIRDALKLDRFELYAQEIAPLSEGKATHYEILLRLRNERGELISPDVFIPAAERYDLMPDVDQWVVRTAFGQFEKLLEDGRPIVFSINLSGQSLCEEGFTSFLVEFLPTTAIRPEQICFEITETAAISNLVQAMALIDGLRQYGYHFALDDFGRGVSSFSYLKNLAIDYIKIDGSFIQDIRTDPLDRLLVGSIYDVAKLLGIQTIAEFVEDDETIKLLREIGVDYAQGYGIARPAPLTPELINSALPDAKPE